MMSSINTKIATTSLKSNLTDQSKITTTSRFIPLPVSTNNIKSGTKVVPSPDSSPRSTSKTKKIVKGIILELLKLEGILDIWETEELTEEDQELIQTLLMNFKNFLAQGFEDYFYLHAMVLLHRVKIRMDFAQYQEEGSVQFFQGDFINIFFTCFFISFKILEENYSMFLEDLELLTGISSEIIEDMEITLLTELLEFEVVVSKEQLIMAEKDLVKIFREYGKTIWRQK